MNGYIDQVSVDWITGRTAEGLLANQLTTGLNPGVRFDPGLMRPWVDGDGQRYMDIMTGKTVYNAATKRYEPEREVVPLQRLITNGLVSPVYNTSALPRDTWYTIDRNVIRASRDRLSAWNDLEAANLYGGFNGMAVEALVRDTMTDVGQAQMDMDGIADEQGDQPFFMPDILPLPITHSGFYLTARKLAQSRNSGMPLDTTLAENCGRRVAEKVENVTIGNIDLSGFVVGSSSEFTRRGIYGFCTQPDRITKTDLTDVSTITQGVTQSALKDDVLEMLALAYAQKFYGPFMLYYSTHYDTIMQEDYFVLSTSGAAAPTKTVIQRLREIEGIRDIKRLDLLTSAQTLILVQMTSETVQAINGLEFTTVQWEEKGGAKLMFRVMCIKIPGLRSQFVGTSQTSRKCGIVHGTTA